MRFFPPEIHHQESLREWLQIVKFVEENATPDKLKLSSARMYVVRIMRVCVQCVYVYIIIMIDIMNTNIVRRGTFQWWWCVVLI